MVEDPGTQHAVVAGQRAGDVLCRLAGVEAHLGALDVHGMPAQVDHRHLAGVPGPRRGLLEEQCHALAGQVAGRRVGSSAAQQALPGPRVYVVHVEQVGHGPPPSCRAGRLPPDPALALGRDRLASTSPRMPQSCVDLLVAHEQWRRHPNGVGSHRVDQEAALEAQAAASRATGAQLGRQQEARTAHRHHPG